VVAANRSTLIQFKILSGVLMFLHSHCGDPFVIYVIYAQSSLELTGAIMCDSFPGVLMFLHSHCGDPFVIYVKRPIQS